MLILCALLLSMSGVVRAQRASVLNQAATDGQEAHSRAQTIGSDGQYGVITGHVKNVDGVPIMGASVRFTSTETAETRDTVSNEAGVFSFAYVVPGSFAVAVSFQGFDTATVDSRVEAGQAISLAPFALKMSVVKIDVNAVVPTREVAAEELHIQEEQRLLGFAPNFFVSYKWDAAPLTSGQKFGLAWKNVSDPGNLLLVGAVAGFQQATDEFNGYGQGAAGYGRRYGADLGNLVVGTFMGGAVLPTLFHQDPRYFYKGTGSFKSRLVYALSSAVVCRGDNGKRQFAWAGVLGDLSAGAISNAYYDGSDRHGAALTLENGFLGVAGDALNGLVQEFFFKEITPKAKKKP